MRVQVFARADATRGWPMVVAPKASNPKAAQKAGDLRIRIQSSGFRAYRV